MARAAVTSPVVKPFPMNTRVTQRLRLDADLPDADFLYQIRNRRQPSAPQSPVPLVRPSALIAVTAWNVRGLAASRLAQAIYDASWSMLFRRVAAKAARARVHGLRVAPPPRQPVPAVARGGGPSSCPSGRAHGVAWGLARAPKAALSLVGKAVWRHPYPSGVNVPSRLSG